MTSIGGVVVTPLWMPFVGSLGRGPGIQREVICCGLMGSAPAAIAVLGTNSLEVESDAATRPRHRCEPGRWPSRIASSAAFASLRSRPAAAVRSKAKAACIPMQAAPYEIVCRKGAIGSYRYPWQRV